jgi:hypothetical protein
LTRRSITADNDPLMVRFASLLALSVALAVLVAGCGGQSAEEKYANGVCTDIGNWKDQIEQSVNDVRNQVQAPGTGTLAAISTNVQSAVGATKNLASDLKSRPAPDTDEGAEAKQDLEALGSQAQATVTKVKQTLANLPQNANLSEIASTLAPLAGSLQSLATKTSSTLESVKSAGSKMKDAFDKSDACKKLS